MPQTVRPLGGRGSEVKECSDGYTEDLLIMYCLLTRHLFAQAVLIVNVASQCGYTDSYYRELQTLRTRHSADKLAIVAFPCNQFGGLEPAPWSEIANFVEREYGASFPIMGKVGDVI